MNFPIGPSPRKGRGKAHKPRHLPTDKGHVSHKFGRSYTTYRKRPRRSTPESRRKGRQ